MATARARIMAATVHLPWFIIKVAILDKPAADQHSDAPLSDPEEPTLANILSAKKRARQSIKRRMHNASFRSLMRTHVKKVVTAIESKDKDAASKAYLVAVPVIDKMVSKGLIHKNKAARNKSRLNARIRAL